MRHGHCGKSKEILYIHFALLFCLFCRLVGIFFRRTLNLIVSTTVSGTVPVEASFLYKDMSEWSWQAHYLVMVDGGLCCPV